MSARRPQTHGLVSGWSRGLAVLLSWQRRVGSAGGGCRRQKEDIWGPGGWVTGRPSPCALQNGRFLGDADLERQKFPDLKLNGPQVRGNLWFWAAPALGGGFGVLGQGWQHPAPSWESKNIGF